MTNRASRRAARRTGPRPPRQPMRGAGLRIVILLVVVGGIVLFALASALVSTSLTATPTP